MSICGVSLVAGCASRTAVAPLERLKILFQVQDYLNHGKAAVGSGKPTGATTAVSVPKYNGVWSSLRRIGAEEGFRGYFRGNGANCARVFPYTAIQFAAYVLLSSRRCVSYIYIGRLSCSDGAVVIVVFCHANTTGLSA